MGARLRRRSTGTFVVGAMVLASFPGASELCAAAESRAYIKPVPGPIVRRFDAPKGPYAPGHRGVDFAAAPGTPVIASNSGVVSFAGPVAGSGFFVTIGHSDGLETTYSFMSAATVKRGAEVTRRQRIGLSGPGHPGENKPVLHFGARVIATKRYIDPELLLSGNFDDLSELISLAPMAQDGRSPNTINPRGSFPPGSFGEDDFGGPAFSGGPLGRGPLNRNTPPGAPSSVGPGPSGAYGGRGAWRAGPWNGSSGAGSPGTGIPDAFGSDRRSGGGDGSGSGTVGAGRSGSAPSGSPASGAANKGGLLGPQAVGPSNSFERAGQSISNAGKRMGSAPKQAGRRFQQEAKKARKIIEKARKWNEGGKGLPASAGRRRQPTSTKWQVFKEWLAKQSNRAGHFVRPYPGEDPGNRFISGMARGVFDGIACSLRGGASPPKMPTSKQFQQGATAPRAPNDNIVVAVAGIGSSSEVKDGKMDNGAAMYQMDFRTLGYKAGQIYHYSYKGIEQRGGDDPYSIHAPYSKEETFKSIALSGEKLARQVKEIHRLNPDRQIDLVAHSQGGVVAQYFVKRFYDPDDPRQAKIDHLVTIGSPHKGTDLAQAYDIFSNTWAGRTAFPVVDFIPHKVFGAPSGSGPSVRQLAEGSQFLRDLNHRWDPKKVKATTIGNAFDVVVPPRHTDLPGNTHYTTDLPPGTILGAHGKTVATQRTKGFVYNALADKRSQCTAFMDAFANYGSGPLIESAEEGFFRGLDLGINRSLRPWSAKP